MERIESHSQILSSHTQFIARHEIQVGQLATVLSRREEGRLPSQSKRNPRKPNMAQCYNVTSPEHAKSIMTLGSGKTIKQPSETKKLEDENVAESELTQDQGNQELRDEQLTLEPSYVPKAPYPSASKSSTPFSQKGGKLEEMLELFK